MADKLFTGGAQDWFSAPAWSPSGIPAAGDNATIASGTALITPLGTLDLGSTLDIAGAAVSFATLTTLTGAGTLEIGAGAAVTLAGSVAPGLQIDFTAPTGTLVVAGGRGFEASVAGLQKGDLIDLPGQVVNDLVYLPSQELLEIKISGTKSAIVAEFTLTGTTAPLSLYVASDGAGGSVIGQSVLREWQGGSADFYSANWLDPASGSTSYPLVGDRALITAGTAALTAADAATYGTLDNLVITLGAPEHAGTAVLAVDTAEFGSSLVIQTAGTALTGEVLIGGSLSSGADLVSNAIGGTLRLDLAGPAAHFANLATGTLSSGAEGVLDVTGGAMTNQGLIQADGGVAVFGSLVTLDGSGSVVITAGGTVSVYGSVAAAQVVQFADQGLAGDVLNIETSARFGGQISGFVQGDTIDLVGLVANDATFDPATGVLSLSATPGGPARATLDLIGAYGSAAFSLTSDGAGGSFLTDDAPAPLLVQSPLPVDAFVPTGGTIGLSQLLLDAFGSIPAGYDTLTLSSESAADLLANSFSYWDPNNPSLSGWIVNGTALAPDTSLQITASQFAGVAFVAGNDISATATFSIPTAFDATGAVSERMQYAVQTIPPGLQGPAAGTGVVTPQDIVASASLFTSVYGGTANNNDCGFIAAANAQAAGAALPSAGSTDPMQNNAGGFWRVVYRGSDPNPVANWGTIVQAGDVVRMEHDTGSPHSTTVLQTLAANGSNDLLVYDNGAITQNHGAIGIHATDLGITTMPSHTTIFRLDPQQLYLTVGQGNDAFIQGSTYDNLIVLTGSADSVAAGAASNLIVATDSLWQGAAVSDFHAGDTLDLTNFDPLGATASYDALTGVLALAGSSGTVTLDLPIGLSGSFAITQDGGTLTGSAADGAIVPAGTSLRAIDGGDLGVLYTTAASGARVPLSLGSATGSMVELVACFAAGTRIATQQGMVAVERLRLGAQVRTHSGGLRPIRWLGRRRLDCRRHPRPEEVWPVRVLAGAFAPGRPRRELWLSPDHAVFLEGVLIPVRHLINGAGIAQLARDEIEYWHVELDRHDVLLAEGLPCESYLDTGNRAAFEGGAVLQLHPDFAARAGVPACAERVEQGARVVAVKQRLFLRCGPPAGAPSLRLVVHAAGRALTPQERGDGWLAYRVPRGVRALELLSPAWSPAACWPEALDRRALGVRLFAVALDGRPLALEDPALAGGFHPLEFTAEGACRWTDGAARLLLPPGTGEVALRVGDGAQAQPSQQGQGRRPWTPPKAARPLETIL